MHYVLRAYEKTLGYSQRVMINLGYGTRDWFKIGKGVSQGYILSPFLFNLYAEYIM